MLTAKAVAALLGLSPRSIYDIPPNLLPCYRMGAGRGAVRYELADVEAYKARTQPTSCALIASRELRTYERLRSLAIKSGGDASALPEMSASQQAAIAKRIRSLRRPRGLIDAPSRRSTPKQSASQPRPECRTM